MSLNRFSTEELLDELQRRTEANQDSQQLSLSEEEELAACKQTIEWGLRTDLDIGSALLAIRDHKLYGQDCTVKNFDAPKNLTAKGLAFTMIREKKLYRGSTPTFEQFVWETWELTTMPVGAYMVLDEVARKTAECPSEDNKARLLFCYEAIILTYQPDRLKEHWELAHRKGRQR